MQVYHPLDSSRQETVSQKKIKYWNKNLQDREIRSLCSDYQNENIYLWSSDPDRKDKDVYDSGEVDLLNQKYELDAVGRDLKKGLTRISTRRRVDWSEFVGKWNDIADEDVTNWR